MLTRYDVGGLNRAHGLTPHELDCRMTGRYTECAAGVLQPRVFLHHMGTNRSASRLAHTLAIGLWLSACSADTPVSPGTGRSAEALQPPRIVVLGDSLAVSPSSTENFVTHLQRRLDDEGYRWILVNAGMSGAVTADGVRRVDALLSTDARILILELGANDGLRGIAVPTIEDNLATTIERARARGVQVLLCGMETVPTHGWDYTVAFHRVFPSLADRYGLPLVPFLLAGVALNATLNGPDGIHPNADGARRIAATVWPYLEPLLVQTPTAAGGRHASVGVEARRGRSSITPR